MTSVTRPDSSAQSGRSGQSGGPGRSAPPSPETVRRLFDAIAARYDRFNSVVSFGRDGAWRRKALGFLRPGMRVLDLGTGTGDMAFEAAGRVGTTGAVTGIDISEPMLSFAARKTAAREARQAATTLRSGGARAGMATPAPIRWICRGAQELPLEDEKAYDAVVSAFVLRNIHSEIARVLDGVLKSLKPGGRIAFLDLTEPESKLLGWGSRLYMSTVVLAIGTLIFRDPEPVKYLKASMQRFFKASEFKALLKEAGFAEVRSRGFLFGAVTLYEASKSR